MPPYTALAGFSQATSHVGYDFVGFPQRISNESERDIICSLLKLWDRCALRMSKLNDFQWKIIFLSGCLWGLGRLRKVSTWRSIKDAIILFYSLSVVRNAEVKSFSYV